MSRRRSMLLFPALLLALMMLLLASLATVFHSTRASRFLLEQVTAQLPELVFNEISGTLAAGLAFDFRYEDDSVLVTGHHTRLDLDASCLWQLSLCIQELQVDRLEVHLKDSPPTADADDTTTTLPSINIPVPVQLQQLQLHQLTVTDSTQTLYQAQDIAASARAIHHRVVLQQVSLQDDWCQWTAEGQIRLTRRYPLLTEVRCSTSQYPFRRVAGTIQGDLDQLALQASSEGDLSAQLNLQLQPLLEHWPLSFTADLLQPFTLQLDSDQAQIQTANVVGHGDLNALDLVVHGKLTSTLLTPTITTTARARLTTEQVEFQQLDVALDQGQIRSSGSLRFADMHWQANSELQAVDFAQFDPRVSGQANGQVHHQGSFTDGQLQLQANLNDLQGKLNDSPWQMQGDVALHNERIRINNLALQQAQNQARINGDLQLDGNSNLTVDLNLRQIERFVPEIKGRLLAQLQVRGSLQRPMVDGHFLGENLSYDDYRLASARGNINWQLMTQASNHLQLEFSQLQLAQELVLGGTLQVSGNEANHRIQIALEETKGNQLQLQCNGRFAMQEQQTLLDQWQANCDRSSFRITYMDPPQHWTLSKPFRLQLQPQLQYSITPFCYQYNGSQLCLQQAVQGDLKQFSPLQIEGRNLYLSWLQPWLPERMDLDGHADLKATVGLLPELAVDARLSSSDASVTLLDNRKRPLPIAIQHSTFRSQIHDQTIQLQWQLETAVGASQGQLQLNNQALKGKLALQQINVEPVSRWLLQEQGDHVSGMINGEFTLQGTVQSPLLQGQAEFSDGRVVTAMLPLPIEDIKISLQTRDRVAQLNGNFNVNKQPGRLDGIFNWQQEQWWSKVSFHSGLLAWEPMKDSEIFLRPDIQFNITPQAVKITGDVAIPKARILLKTLPDQAISSSPDAIIVSDEPAQQDSLAISSHLNLTLGKDVRVKGYGLDTYLTGGLTISQQQADLLRSKGIIHLEQGTYTAYGQTLNITDGDVIFIDELDNPQLRLSAVRDNVSDNVVVGIRVTGRAQNPEITLFSIPEMPQQEKFHYLITGTAPNTATGQSSSSLAAEAALSMALESRSGFTRKAGEKVGIKDLTLSAGSTENRSEVGLSGYITQDLMIRYGVGMFEAVNTVTLKYRIRQNLFAEVISGKSNAFDILWSFTRD